MHATAFEPSTAWTAGLVATVLLLLGMQHLIWMVSPWPLRSWADFARYVVGVEPKDRPSAPLTLLVAGLLLAAGYLVAARAGLLPAPGPHWLHRLAAPVVAAVLLLRGLIGLASSARAVRRPGTAGPGRDFARWDLRLYSPLCLALAAGILVVVLPG